MSQNNKTETKIEIGISAKTDENSFLKMIGLNAQSYINVSRHTYKVTDSTLSD